MADEALSAWPAIRMLAAFRAGEASPVDVLEAAIARIARHDGVLNAVIEPTFEQAAADAALAQERWYRGAPRALEGVPVLVKDLLDTAGTRTTYGSPMFDAHVPTVDAAAVDRLRGCGAIVLAKTATHEFGWGITTASEHYGPTRNPWATDRSPGGSSGGSAAGLAAGYAPLALGTDTAGSIRIPAAFCGVAGLKPTFGAVDTGGLRTFAPSLDHIGPMARSVDDLALLWSVLGDRPAPPVPTRTENPVVGVLTGRPGPELAPAVRSGCAAAAAALAGSGCRVVEVDGRGLGAALDALATAVLAEGIATHRRTGLWPDRAAEYGPDVRARLEHAEQLGPDAISAALAGRAAVRAAMDTIFQQVDVLLSPVSTIGPCPVDAVPADYRERVMTDIAPQSLAGLPALALRAGFDDDGLPVGVQLSAAGGHESLLLDLGRSLELATARIQAREPAF